MRPDLVPVRQACVDVWSGRGGAWLPDTADKPTSWRSAAQLSDKPSRKCRRMPVSRYTGQYTQTFACRTIKLSVQNQEDQIAKPVLQLRKENPKSSDAE